MRALPAPKEHFGWLLDRVRYSPTAQMRAIEAVDSAGRIRGMVGFDRWTPNSCEVHLALDAPATGRCLIRPSMEYAFIQADKGLMLAKVCSDNLKSLSLAVRMGFRESSRLKDGWSCGIDIIVLELHRGTCGFLMPNRGERWPTSLTQ